MRINGNIEVCINPEHSMPTTSPSSPPSRKATNVTLGADLLATAKALRINISQAAEAGLARAVAERQAQLWLEANQAALESSNAYVEKYGLPLAKYRGF